MITDYNCFCSLLVITICTKVNSAPAFRGLPYNLFNLRCFENERSAVSNYGTTGINRDIWLSCHLSFVENLHGSSRQRVYS